MVTTVLPDGAKLKVWRGDNGVWQVRYAERFMGAGRTFMRGTVRTLQYLARATGVRVDVQVVNHEWVRVRFEGTREEVAACVLGEFALWMGGGFRRWAEEMVEAQRALYAARPPGGSSNRGKDMAKVDGPVPGPAPAPARRGARHRRGEPRAARGVGQGLPGHHQDARGP